MKSVDFSVDIQIFLTCCELSITKANPNLESLIFTVFYTTTKNKEHIFKYRYKTEDAETQIAILFITLYIF